MDPAIRRKIGKALNYQLLNLAGSARIAAEASIDRASAEALRARWRERFPIAAAMINQLIEEARAAGVPAPSYLSAVWTRYEARALDRVLAGLPGGPCRLLVPLYDGLLVEAPATRAAEAASWLRAALRDAMAAEGLEPAVKVKVLTTWGG